MEKHGVKNMLYDFEHLLKTKSNYIKHFKYAMYYNFLALMVFITGMIHAFVPFLFPYLPYELAKKITDGTEKNFK